MKTCGHPDAVIDFGNIRLCVACANSPEYARRKRAFQRHMGAVMTVERATSYVEGLAWLMNNGHADGAKRMTDEITQAVVTESALGFHKIAQDLARLAIKARKLTQTT